MDIYPWVGRLGHEFICGRPGYQVECFFLKWRESPRLFSKAHQSSRYSPSAKPFYGFFPSAVSHYRAFIKNFTQPRSIPSGGGECAWCMWRQKVGVWAGNLDLRAFFNNSLTSVCLAEKFVLRLSERAADAPPQIIHFAP